MINKMKNKKGESTMSPVLIKLVLLVLLVIVVIVSLYKLGILDYFRNLPDFNETEYGKKAIAEQENVPAEEKAIYFAPDGGKPKEYPIVRLIYTEGANDYFAFRWNPNLNKMLGRVQILMRIRESVADTLNSYDLYESDEWQINPDLSEEFREQKAMYTYEKKDIIDIMKAESEDEMVEKIAKASKREDAEIDFPLYGTALDFQRWHSDKMNAEEIQVKIEMLKENFFVGYENE